MPPLKPVEEGEPSLPPPVSGAPNVPWLIAVSLQSSHDTVFMSPHTVLPLGMPLCPNSIPIPFLWAPVRLD